MGHHDDGGAVAVQFLEQLHDAARHVRVEIAGGLIRQQQPRRPGERAGDGHALLLAARQLRRVVPAARRQSHPGQRVLDAAAPLGAVEAAVAQRNLDIVLHVQVRNQVERLKDEADLLVAQSRALIVIQAAHVGAVQLILAAAEFLEQSRNGEKRGLAGSRGSGHGDELAFAHMDREIAQRKGLDDFCSIRFREVGHFKHGGLLRLKFEVNGSG